MQRIVQMKNVPYQAGTYCREIPMAVIIRFINAMEHDAQTYPDENIRRLAAEFVECRVLIIDNVITFMDNQMWADGTDTWVPFLRSIFFIGHNPQEPESNPTMAVSRFGCIEPTHRSWSQTQRAHVYTPHADYPVPKEDPRISGRERYHLRKAVPGIAQQINVTTGDVPDIVESWLNHPHSYGLRNGFLQLCLWRLHESFSDRRTYLVTTEDGGKALCGYVPTPHIIFPVDWVFHTYWQFSGEHPMGTTALAATLPLLNGPVLITCPSETGGDSYQHFESYKRKFSTSTLNLYTELAAPFEAEPPYYNTLRREPVL